MTLQEKGERLFIPQDHGVHRVRTTINTRPSDGMNNLPDCMPS
jgi:hypothetical protein